MTRAYAGTQLTTAAMLLHEGVEGGEEVGHGAASVAGPSLSSPGSREGHSNNVDQGVEVATRSIGPESGGVQREGAASTSRT